jgi:Carboxypeptidase regulatory-like domain
MIGQSGSVRGSILDPSGAAVAGTHITLSGHGAARTTTSDASGNYQLSSLNPGTYTLTRYFTAANGVGGFVGDALLLRQSPVSIRKQR